MSSSNPRVTFFLFCYRQEQYVEEAVRAALAQRYSPLRIVISDDASPDGTLAVIQRVVSGYDGPHEVIIRQNVKNLGLIGHVNTAFALLEDELMVVAAGDDVSLPERTDTIVNAWVSAGSRPWVIHSSVTAVDADGHDQGLLVPSLVTRKMTLADVARSRTAILGATQAWPRALIRHFGDIRDANCYEDLVMVFRSLLLGGHIHLPEPLVRYRTESGMLASGRRVRGIRGRLQQRVKGERVSIAILSQRMADARLMKRQWLVFIMGLARARHLVRVRIVAAFLAMLSRFARQQDIS